MTNALGFTVSIRGWLQARARTPDAHARPAC